MELILIARIIYSPFCCLTDEQTASFLLFLQRSEQRLPRLLTGQQDQRAFQIKGDSSTVGDLFSL